MIRRLILISAIAIGIFSPSVTPAISAPSHVFTSAVAYSQLAMFDTEDAAQAHCPADVVVWLNTHTGIWHEKGMRWYGRTRQGAYVCRKEAGAAGYRDTRNGQ